MSDTEDSIPVVIFTEDESYPAEMRLRWAPRSGGVECFEVTVTPESPKRPEFTTSLTEEGLMKMLDRIGVLAMERKG